MLSPWAVSSSAKGWQWKNFALVFFDFTFCNLWFYEQGEYRNPAGGDSPEAGDIKIKAPDIAENGAVVPVTVSTGLENVESISILAAKNGNPLIASFNLGEGAEPFVSTRIKMGATADVIALVKAGGKLYSAKKEVKVTIGGCGG